MIYSVKANPKLLVKPAETKAFLHQRLGFVFLMWFLSRFVVIAGMQLLAPFYPATPTQHDFPIPLGFEQGFIPKMGWELFTHWDAAWYLQIATKGYQYVNDGGMHNIAFFPVLPLAMIGLMKLGFSPIISGVLINNLALLGAMWVAYCWVEENHGVSAAKWTTAVLAWCPFSIFGTVIYTEGLFLFFSTSALRSFEREQYVWAGFWGVLTTATRVTGLALIPTFVLVAWREKRQYVAYLVALLTGLGLVAFSIYCAVNFGDPIAFVHAQKGWGTSAGFNLQGWGSVISNIFAWRFGAIKEITKLVMVFGGAYLLWHYRYTLGRVALLYGFCSIALILSSGSILSVNRFAYAIIPLAIALGLLLSRHTRIGFATIGLFAMLLAGFSIRFAWWRWVA